MKTGVFYGTERSNAPYNMLINSNLRRPINQRDATYAPMWDYGIDMWREYAGNARADFAFDSDGMTLTGTIAQKIPSSTFVSGNPYSAVLYMADGTVLVASGAVNIAGSPWTGFASAERGNVKITLFTDAQDGSYIGVRIGASGEKIRACALYEGEYTADTVPPYVPRPYSVELEECQRYYYRLDIGNSNFVAHAFSATVARFAMLLPTDMRIYPTVKLSGNLVLLAPDKVRHTVTGVSINYNKKNCANIALTTSELTIYETYGLHGQAGDNAAVIELSADL